MSTRYNANSIESHLAIEIAAKVIKHMATDQQIEEIVSKGHLSVNGDDGGVSNFEGEFARRIEFLSCTHFKLCFI